MTTGFIANSYFDSDVIFKKKKFFWIFSDFFYFDRVPPMKMSNRGEKPPRPGPRPGAPESGVPAPWQPWLGGCPVTLEHVWGCPVTLEHVWRSPGNFGTRLGVAR